MCKFFHLFVNILHFEKEALQITAYSRIYKHKSETERI